MTDNGQPQRLTPCRLSRTAEAWLDRRSQAFAEATSRDPGKRDSYGTGKEPAAPKARKPRARG